MSIWKKSILYLGLGPDEAYDDYDQPGPGRPGGEVAVRSIDPRSQPSEGRPGPRAAPGRPAPNAASAPGLRPVPRSVADAMEQQRPAPAEESRHRLVAKPVVPTSSRGLTALSNDEGHTVRAVPLVRTAKPHVVSPASFSDAQEVGDRFRRNEAVIVNLQSADRDLSRRLIDFVSGLCYGLNGQMERVAKQVYLLTPADVEVSAEDRLQMREQGLYRG